jgi:hypothetical protein
MQRIAAKLRQFGSQFAGKLQVWRHHTLYVGAVAWFGWADVAGGVPVRNLSWGTARSHV